MAKIIQTRLGTSDVPGDICHNAFALFPIAGKQTTIRAGASFAEKSNSLINKHPQLANFRLKLSSGVTVLAGVCGPGYGILFDAAGETNGKDVKLAISNDKTAAGFFAGYKVSFSATCRLEDWYPIRGWKPIFDLKPGFSVDVLNLLVELIKEAMGADSKGKVEDGVEVKAEDDDTKNKGKKVKSIAIYDFVQNQFAKDGFIKVVPSYDIPVNIAEMMPALKGFIKALKKLWGSFGFGPMLSLMIPTEIKLTQIRVNEQTYEQLKFANGEVTGVATGSPQSAPSTLGVTLNHRPGFDLGLSFFAEISVCKFFKLGASTPKIPLLQLMGIVPQVGPFPNTLSNQIGRQTVASLQCAPDERDLIEVVLEPAAVMHG